MNVIENFQEVRRDGQIISEGMTSEQIDALGDISRVVEVRWQNSLTGKTVSVKSKFGVLSKVIDGRRWVAAMVYDSDTQCSLVIFDSGGEVHLRVPNVQRINDEERTGLFAGFSEPHSQGDGVFGVIFRTEGFDWDRYWMDIDALTGKVLTCTWTK
jgi:hypothetical protein